LQIISEEKGRKLRKNRISNKLFCIFILFILVISTVFTALPLASSGVATKTAFDSNMTTLWTNPNVGISSGTSPCVVDGVLYVCEYDDKNVYALNASSGEKIWNYAVTGNLRSTSPCVANGIVYVGSGTVSADKNVYALNASSGEKIWNYTTGNAVQTIPAVADGVVYVGSNDKNVYALNASSGEKIWNYTTSGTVLSSPAVADGVVYVGSNDKNVYALDASSGAQIWSYTTGNGVQTGPAVVDGVVYVGSYDKNVYALNASSGEKIWNYPVATTSMSSPFVADGVVYVRSSFYLYALNATTTSATGELLWRYTTSGTQTSSPYAVDGIVYMGGSNENKLYAFNATTTSASGEVLWTYTTTNGVYGTPYVVDDVLYMGSSTVMYAFGPVRNVIQTCDSTGTEKSAFITGDDIYFSATGLNASTTYPLYVFAKDAAWAIGDAYSTVSRCANSATTVTANSHGDVVLTRILPEAENGEYYIALDLNADGVYDSGDLLIDDVYVTSILLCDSAGNEKSVFNPAWSSGANNRPGENVYLKAAGLNASTSYPIYIFIKNESWTTGMAFPARYYHTAASVTTDSAGNIPPTSIYSQITAGEYYVALDVNTDGVYDSGDFLIDDVAVTLALVALNSTGGVQKELYLTPEQLHALPSYTGVGLPRRSGGYYPLAMLGNYTGVPLPVLCSLVGGMAPGGFLKAATTVDGFAAIIPYSQAYDNIYTQFNITLGKQHEGEGDNPSTIITGQSPLTMLAYAVNGTNLYSDASGGGDSDLGGPLRIYVVSNNGTSPILANDGVAVFGTTMCKFVSSIVITNPGSLSSSTTDSAGTAKSTFDWGETMYFTATGLNASTAYPLYVVQDRPAWTVRIPFPDRVSGSSSSVTTDSSGRVTAASIYADTQPGQYAIIVDLNSNGKYDEADLIVTNTTVTTNPVEYTLTMLTNGEGTVSPGNQTYPVGTTVDLKAFDADGWSFTGWSGDASGTDNTTITIDGNKVVTAAFMPLYTLTMYTTGQGTVSPGNQTYLSGTIVDLKAFTAQGWGFAGWSGDASGYVNTTITMDGDMTVTATFTQDTYTLTMITAGQGTVSPGNQTYLSGTSVDLQAFNAQGWTFTGWSGDVTGTGNTTIIMNGNKAVTATFTAQTSPTPTPSSSTSTSTPPPANTPTPTPTPTPTQTSNATTITVITDTGASVNLTISGTITSTQLSNITIATDQTAGTTAISFKVTGESGTTGYGNITIPKTAVSYGTEPVVYIDGQPAENQSYTEDADNYYVYYTVHFSTHQVTIEFTGQAEVATSLWLVIASVVAFVVVLLFVVTVALRRRKKSRTQ